MSIYNGIGRLTDAEPGGARTNVIRLLPYVPAALVHAILVLIGALLWAVWPKLRRTVAGNMAEVLKGCSPWRIRRLTLGYFVNLAVILYELLLDCRQLPERGEHRIRLEGEEHLAAALSRGRGAIVYAPHVGNFFYSFWRLSRRYDGLAVATAGSPELRPIYLGFQKLGCRGLDYDELPPLVLIRRLREHLAGGGIVYILGDFHRTSFPATRLLGRLTRGPAGAAALALDRQVPVIPCFGYRERGFRHVVKLGEPVLLHEIFRRDDRQEAQQRLNDMLSAMILKKPEQWFYWFEAHERWTDSA